MYDKTCCFSIREGLPHHQFLRLLLVRRCAVKLIEPPAVCCPHQLYCKVKGVFPAVFQPLVPLFGSLSLVGPGGAVAAGERAFSSEIPPQCYG